MKKITFVLGALMVFALAAPVQAEGDTINVQAGATINYVGGQIQPQEVAPVDEVLGLSTASLLTVKDYVCFNSSNNTATCPGFYFDGTTLKVRVTSSGAFTSIGGTTPGDEGWIADSLNNYMTPATNATGDYYPIVLGEAATSTPATANTELYVGGGGELVTEGQVFVGVSGTGADFTAYSDTANQSLFWDASENLLDIGGQATTSSATGNIQTRGTLVVGQSAFGTDVTFYTDTADQTFLWDASENLLSIGGRATTTADTGNFQAHGTLTIGGAATLSSTLAVTGAATLSSTLELGGNASTTGSNSVKSANFSSDTGEISFSNENLTTTGNSSAANGTFTGSLTVDTSTFFVDNTNDRVGIGSTTPQALLSVEAIAGSVSVLVASSTSEYFKIDDSGVVTFNGSGTANADFTVQGDSNTALFTVDASADKVGIASSTPQAVLAVEALTGQTAFLVGSSTAELFKIDLSGNVTFNNGGWSDADFTVQGDAQSSLFFIDASADKIGVASSTPYAVLSVEALTGQTAFSVGSSSAELFGISNNGSVAINSSGWSEADFTVQGDAQSSLFFIDASLDRIGIASSTPQAVLSVEALTGQNAFIVGSSTGELFKIDDSGAVTFNQLGSANADFRIDSDSITSLFFVDSSANQIGIGTSTPTDLVSGFDSAATSTLLLHSGGSGLGGSIILEDTSGTACTEIYTLAGVVAARTIDCP